VIARGCRRKVRSIIGDRHVTIEVLAWSKLRIERARAEVPLNFTPKVLGDSGDPEVPGMGMNRQAMTNYLNLLVNKKKRGATGLQALAQLP